MAVDYRYQGQGLGYDTIAEVFKTYSEVIKKVGAIALVVDAYVDKAAFYEKFGFERLNVPSGKSVSLYLMTQTIAALKKV